MKKLPVFAALGHAFKSTTDNIGFAFHISWPWMLLLLPINIMGNIYLTLNAVQDPSKVDPLVFFIVVSMACAGIIAYSSIAVNWHRYILLDEVAEGWTRLRIDGLMWRYIGNVFLIVILLSICSIPVALIGFALKFALGDAGLIVIVPAIFAIYAVAIVSMYRWFVKLPGIAVGRRDFGLRDAWRATAGNFWQILGLLVLFVLCLLVVGLLMLGVSYVLGANGGLPGLSISLAIQVAVNWVATILGVTLLTSLYGYFVEGREF